MSVCELVSGERTDESQFDDQNVETFEWVLNCFSMKRYKPTLIKRIFLLLLIHTKILCVAVDKFVLLLFLDMTQIQQR